MLHCCDPQHIILQERQSHFLVSGTLFQSNELEAQVSLIVSRLKGT